MFNHDGSELHQDVVSALEQTPGELTRHAVTI